MNILLDTSPLISFFAEDVHTEKSIILFNDIFTGKITASIPAFVLVEFCGALSRKAGKENAQLAFKQVQTLLNQNTLNIIPQTDETYTLACHLALQYGIKGSDAVISALAQQYNLTLATFDKEITNKLKNEIDLYKEFK
ncbi:hypothetical protein A2642_04515 [Candidatus Nomurabacteria bacterium RIFCSPHIGHO2_01_FULL_39_10]|uniref:PIN domain-containing protein n=1 Tax=Candidatus Nomurabacteria bacterium RIFCSPHIGHO2_01_FULL_39_10 TaxID=1801733 RepID=A0A1F6V7M3_9BACT|nr:MAG: hypothetical protein A2642_04515 [Candidatus Nomurabacteria bacterium RIFCSPHIGHO2_01_FULL_39_10]